MTDPPSTTCFACGYDMYDRVRGDLCPECATPFDDRPDWPNEKNDASVIFWCGAGAHALLLLGVLSSFFLTDGLAWFSVVGVLLGFLTVAMASWPGPNPRTHRAAPRRKRLRLIGQVLAWVTVLLPFVVFGLVALAMLWF